MSNPDEMTQGYISPRLLAELEAHAATLGTTAVENFKRAYIEREPARQTAMGKLRWIEGQMGDNGFSGDLSVASVVRVDEPDDESRPWQWCVHAVRTQWVCHGQGYVGTAAQARRSAEVAWDAWLAHAGLQAAPRPMGTAIGGVES